MIRKVFFVLVLIIMMYLVVGCRTVQGLGDDIKWTGEKGAELLEGQ